MRGRRPFDGRHQEQALRALLHWEDGALRTPSGRGLEEIADELGMAVSSLHRYLSGGMPLRSDQFAAFAAAFETTLPELILACFPPVSQLAPEHERLLRDLLAAGGVSPDVIAQMVCAFRATGRPTSEGAIRRIAAGVVAIERERAVEGGADATDPVQARRRA